MLLLTTSLTVCFCVCVCSGLYAQGQMWLEREDIVGIARASVPYVGMLTILLNDYPWLKVVLVGGMGLLVFTQRE